MSAPHPDQLDLEEYARGGSREALGRLAQRHLNFVFGVARRAVGGDVHLAEDVTQAVFLVFARRAAQVKPAYLSGWLFTTTRHVARNAQKVAARRRHHERRAAALSKETVMPSEVGDAEHLQAHLHSALAAAGRKDRAIVLMRYVQGMDIGAIGELLGISEVAARKRLERAIERLRQNLSSRGIGAGSLAIGAAVSSVAEPAPPALAAAVSGAATAAASSSAGLAVSLARSSILWTRFHAAAVVILSLGLLAGISATIWRVAFNQPVAMAALTVAPPATVPVGNVTYTGVVTGPDGTSLVGVRVWSQLTGPDPDQVRLLEAETVTDERGRYTLPPLPAIESLNSRGLKGNLQRDLRFDHASYGLGSANARPGSQFQHPDDVELAYAVRMEPATQIQIKAVDDKGRPVSGASVRLDLQSNFPGNNGTVYYRYLSVPALTAPQIRTDATGMATFPRIGQYVRAHVTITAPGYVRYWSRDVFNGEALAYPLRAGAGPLVAVLHPGGQIRIRSAPGGPPLPRASEILAFRSTFRLSPIYHTVVVQLDGSYLLDGMEPGPYELAINPYGASTPDGIWNLPESIQLDAGHTVETTAERIVGRLVVGRAADAAGQPVEGHRIQLRHVIHDHEAGLVRTYSSADGRFQFRAVPGDYQLIPMDYGAVSTPRAIVVPATADAAPLAIADIQVSPFPVIRGKLVDASGRPIAGRVYARAEVFDTAEDGTFAFKPANDAGKRLYAISRSGILGATVALDEKFIQPRRGAQPDEVPTIGLRAMAMLSGNVISESASQVPDAGISVKLPDTENGPMLPKWMSLHRDGSKFTIGPIPPGIAFNISINVGGSGGASARLNQEPLAPGEMRDLGDITLHSEARADLAAATPASKPAQPDLSGEVRGQVVDESGQPVIAANVQCVAEPGSLYVPPVDTTDQEGRFVLKGVPAHEPLSILIRATGFRRLRVTAGPAADVSFKLIPVASDLVGKPAPELDVEQWLSGGPVRLADLRGKVVLLHIGIDTRNGAYPGTRHEIFNTAEKFTGQLAVILIHRELPPAGRGVRGAGSPINQMSPQPTPLPTAIDSRQTRTIDDIHYFGATAKIYGVENDVISGPAMVLIDKKGVVRAVPNASNLNQWIEKLLIE